MYQYHFEVYGSCYNLGVLCWGPDMRYPLTLRPYLGAPYGWASIKFCGIFEVHSSIAKYGARMLAIIEALQYGFCAFQGSIGA